MLSGDGEDARSLDWTSGCRELFLVQLGELPSGRQVVEGADLALGTTATLNALRDPQKRDPIRAGRLTALCRCQLLGLPWRRRFHHSNSRCQHLGECVRPHLKASESLRAAFDAPLLWAT